MADDGPADDPSRGDRSGTDDDGSGRDRPPEGGPAADWTRPPDWPADEEVVRAAADAAEDVVFSRFDRSAVADLDVTVRFEAGVLEVDVYLDAPDAAADVERVADDAALAARAAVDELLSD